MIPPPSVRNDVPSAGWHRQVVVIKGDWMVWYWPPSSDEKPLKSIAELKEWLAHGNALSMLASFDYDAEATLTTSWTRVDDERRVGQSRTRPRDDSQEIFVETALGYSINRNFEFRDDENFWLTHDPYLRTLRKSVARDIFEQCKAEKLRRAKETVPPPPRSRAGDVAGRSEEDSRTVLEPECLVPTAHKILKDVAQSSDATELHILLSTTTPPFLERLDDGGGEGSVFKFDLFTSDYCNRLVEEISLQSSYRDDRLPYQRRSSPCRRVLLDDSLANKLLVTIATPVAEKLFREYHKKLDSHVAFFEFGGKRHGTYERFDEAHAVLDILLRGEAQERTFHGSFSAPVFPPLRVDNRSVGSALLYRGHQALSRLKSPHDSINLVLWCRSEES